MTALSDAQTEGMAAIVLAAYPAGSINPQIWQEIKDSLIHYLVKNFSFIVPPFHGTAPFYLETQMSLYGIASVGLPIGKWVTPHNLERIGNIVTTYPQDRRLIATRPEQLRCLEVYVPC